MARVSRPPKPTTEEKPPKKRGLPPHLTPGNPGNSGGKKGRSGRKPNAFREMCQKLLSSKEHQRALATVLSDPENPGFSSVHRTIAGYAHGKPDQKLTLEKLVVFDMTPPSAPR